MFEDKYGNQQVDVPTDISSEVDVVQGIPDLRIGVRRIRGTVTGSFVIKSNSTTIASFGGGTGIDIPGLRIVTEPGADLRIEGSDTGSSLVIQYYYKQEHQHAYDGG